MRRVPAMAAMLAVLSICARGDGLKSRWQINLQQEFGFHSFAEFNGFAWTKQQGIVFLSPDRIAVYQVKHTLNPAPLSKRDETGGAGNFFLDVRVLGTTTGKLVKSMLLPTNAGRSQVVRLNQGRFLARTGDSVSLYSRDFSRVGSLDLPLDHNGSVEDWQCEASPDGNEVVLAHQHLYHPPERLFDGTVITSGRSDAEVRILDSHSFEVLKTMKFANFITGWTAGNHRLISTDPREPFSNTYGVLNYDSSWQAIPAPWNEEKDQCPSAMSALEGGLIAAHGCHGLVILSAAGKLLRTLDTRRGESVESVASAGHFLAEKSESYTIISRSPWRIDINDMHIEAFDLSTGERLASIPVWESNVDYAISSDGYLAIVEGEVLSVVKVGP